MINDHLEYLIQVNIQLVLNTIANIFLSLQGCGTGNWCIEMSQEWKELVQLPDYNNHFNDVIKSAEFWGMDLTPIQPNTRYYSKIDKSIPYRVNWLIANL